MKKKEQKVIRKLWGRLADSVHDLSESEKEKEVERTQDRIITRLRELPDYSDESRD